MPINHENALKAPVARFLRAQGYHTTFEFPVGNRTIDVLAWNDDGYLIAVELKINNWLRGLQQASFYAGWSDEAFLAMPAERARAAQSNPSMFQSTGIGLLTVAKGQCERQIPAQEQQEIHLGQDRIAVLAALEARK